MADFEAIFELDDTDKIDCIFDINATVYNYEALDKLPQINGETLIGNKTSEQLGLQPLGDYATNDTVIEIRDNLQDSIDGVSQEVSQEASDREDADESLQEQITANTNNFANYRTASNQDIIDLSLSNRITANTNNFVNYRTSANQDVIDATKQDVINDLETIRANAQSGKSANDTITTYGNIVTHNVSEFATAQQGTLADTSLQPNDNISELINDIGYITSASLPTVNDGKLTIKANGVDVATFTANQSSNVTANISIPDSATWGNITGTLSNQTDLQNALNSKQNNLSQGNDIVINNNVVSVSETLRTQVAQNTSDIKDIQLFKFPNANIIGEPLINNGNVSRFSSSDYMTFPFVVDVRNKEFYIEFCYTTTNDVTTQQNIIDSYFGLAIAIQNGKWTVAASSNGTSWDIGVATGTHTIQPNTTYHVRAGWDLTTYYLDFALESEEYIRDITTQSSLGLFPTTIYIGGSPNLFGAGSAHPALGTINMNHCYLYISDLLVWQGMDSAGMATRADVSLSNLDSVGLRKITYTAGSGISIVDNVISNTQTSAEWGNITGDLSNQTDLQTALSGKQPTGDYALRSELPTVPTKTSELTNDSGFITSSYHDSTKQDTLVSGTNIKTINNESIVGSGNIEIKSAPDVDNVTISKNSSDELQAIGVIDGKTNNADKFVTLTKAEYNALETKDSDTFYSITDDSDITLNLLQTIYPVGSLYITFNDTCPLASLFGTWQIVGTDKVLQGAGSRGSVGTTLSESLPNIKGGVGVYNSNNTYGATTWNNTSVSGSSITGAGTANGYVDFNASRSSSTYQDNAPVQQDAILVNFFRRIA